MKNTSYRIATDVLFQKVDDETVLLEPTTGQYYTLDPVGTFMIEHLKNGDVFSEIIQKVKNTYDVSVEEVTADLEALITNMLKQELIIKNNA